PPPQLRAQFLEGQGELPFFSLAPCIQKHSCPEIPSIDYLKEMVTLLNVFSLLLNFVQLFLETTTVEQSIVHL
ncbi:hypothetical protein E2320_016683, partial [Naja naja]